MQTYNHLIDKSKIDSINSILVELTNLNNLLDGTELNNLKFFNRVYVFVAKELELSVSANKFIYPELIKKLDTAFALYYFDALNYFVENKKLPKLWNDVIEEKLFTPFYFLLGANVHINHDLSLAIVSSVANLPEFKNDFDATDKVISKAIKNFFKTYKPAGKIVFIKNFIVNITQKLIILTILRWRHAAWRDAGKINLQKLTKEDLAQKTTDISKRLIRYGKLFK